MSSPLQIVLMTVPNMEKAREMGRLLVEERLIACINIIPEVHSIYEWEGKICEEGEVLTLLKTMKEKVPSLEKRIAELHPYTTPEFVVIDPCYISNSYLNWAQTYLK